MDACRGGVRWPCDSGAVDTYLVTLASPVGQRTPGRISGTCLHASSSSGPADLWMADTGVAEGVGVSACP